MSKKRRDEGGGGDDWLNTYADMVTLLLTFFAVLLSMSSTDEAKFNAFIRSFSNLPQEVIEEITSNAEKASDGEVVVNTAMSTLYEDLDKYITENNQQEMIEISMIDGVIYVSFKSSLFFEPNQYILRKESTPILSFIGDGIKGREDSIKMVNVLGFTATIENGTYWMLSGERAAVVASFFNDTSGLDGNKLTVLGYGNRYPVATNATAEGRKQNRRVEIVIVGNDSPDDFNISNSLDEKYGNNEEFLDAGDLGAALEAPVEEDVSPYDE